LADRSGWARINGPYNQDGAFGANVMLSLSALAGGGLNLRFAGKSKPLTKILFALALSVMGAALFFNYYRTIWLSTLAGLAVWVLIKKRRIWFLIPVAVMCFLVFGTYKDQILSSYLFSERVANTENIEFRKDRFAVAFGKFKQHPLTGIGIFNLYREAEMGTGAHNTYLSLLGEMGAPGLGAFALLMLLFSYQACKTYGSHPSLVRRKAAGIFLCGIVGYLMTGMSLLTGYQPEINNLLFALAGVAASKPQPDKTSAVYGSLTSEANLATR
jgi:O-antigen ligase